MVQWPPDVTVTCILLPALVKEVSARWAWGWGWGWGEGGIKCSCLVNMVTIYLLDKDVEIP